LTLSARVRAIGSALSRAAASRLVLASIALLVASAPRAADARGKPHECKPDGAPVALGAQDAIEMAEPIPYSGSNHIVSADKLKKPSKLRLISASGEAIELPNPPWTMEPTRFLSRGRAIYAVGSGRSQTAGKTDVMLVRWGTDSRPRLTKIATIDRLAAPPRAALVDEFMAVLWAEPDANGKLHARASFIDIEELKVGAVQDLGSYAQDGFAEITAAGHGFVALWSTEQGVMRAALDVRGKGTAAPAILQWKDASTVHAAIACDAQTWLLHDAGIDKVAVSVTDAQGVARKVTTLASSDTAAERNGATLLCANDNVLVAHRTVHAKAGNVVFWISTVEPSGKTRERRIKDVSGASDTIRMPALSAAGGARSAFWVEGDGRDAKLWSRSIVCN
jgi:hypothetical protein